MAAKKNITIDQGATWRWSLVWKDSAGQPVDITGWTGRMQVRSAVSSDTVLLELTTANGSITIDGQNGKVSLEASATQTGAITVQDGVYDVELEDQAGYVKRLVQGRVHINLNVTR